MNVARIFASLTMSYHKILFLLQISLKKTQLSHGSNLKLFWAKFGYACNLVGKLFESCNWTFVILNDCICERFNRCDLISPSIKIMEIRKFFNLKVIYKTLIICLPFWRYQFRQLRRLILMDRKAAEILAQRLQPCLMEI